MMSLQNAPTYVLDGLSFPSSGLVQHEIRRHDSKRRTTTVILYTASTANKEFPTRPENSKPDDIDFIDRIPPGASSMAFHLCRPLPNFQESKTTATSRTSARPSCTVHLEHSSPFPQNPKRHRILQNINNKHPQSLIL